MPLTAVQTLNNEVLPTFEAHGAVIGAVLSDNGREFYGRADQHPYELFLQLEGIVHKTARVGRPQSNDIVERLHRSLLDEHLRVQGRTVWHENGRRDAEPRSMPGSCAISGSGRIRAEG